MKICPKCLSENADTAKRCQACAEPLQQSGGKTCPAGRHTMDPTWTECVYCKQENTSVAPPVSAVRTPTVVEGTGSSQNRPPNYAETKYESGRQPLSRPGAGMPSPPPSQPPKSTVYRNVAAEPGATVPSVQKDRKIVGVLVTYSWKPEGQVFPIFQGRNVIGRDKECEVCIPEDQTLSGKNSYITFHRNFVIGDAWSMSGTDLNGAPVEQQALSVANFATIRAGSTFFTFIAVQPPEAAAPSAPAEG